MHGDAHGHRSRSDDAAPRPRLSDRPLSARRAAAWLLAALTAGCGGLHTHHVITGPPGPPYAGAVAVHMEGAPLPAQYEEVALVQAEGGGADLGTLLPALQREAAALGCDAVILVKVDQGARHGSATGVAVRVRSAPQRVE